MFSSIKRRWAGLAVLIILLSSFTIFGTHLSANSTQTGYSCAPPTNFSSTNQTTSSVTLQWNGSSGNTSYKVWYVRTGDGYTSTEQTVSGTNFTYTSLPAGNYDFYLVAICPSGISEYIIMEDLLMG